MGHVGLPTTGDPFIDRWEAQIANGETPDLTEGMLPEKRAEIKKKIRAKIESNTREEEAKQHARLEKTFASAGNDIAAAYASEFNDDYGKVP